MTAQVPWAATAPREEIGRRIAWWRLHTQFLADPSASRAKPVAPQDVVRQMLGVQAENLAQSQWAVATRTQTPDAAAFVAAYDCGEIVRTHVLRPTWHYTHRDDLRWLIEVTRPNVIAVLERARAAVNFTNAELERAYGVLVAALSDRSCTRAELAKALADSGSSATEFPLMYTLDSAEQDQLIVSGPLRDGTQTYALFDDRVPAARLPDRDQLLADLALGYLRRHGPATIADLQYWASQSRRDAKAAVLANEHVLTSFTVDGQTFYYVTDQMSDPAAVAAPSTPRAHLLQILDEFYRGYQDSRWVLDVAGLIPPNTYNNTGMILVDGQVLGSCKRTATKTTLTYDLAPLRALTKRELADLDAAAHRAASFLGLAARLRA